MSDNPLRLADLLDRAGSLRESGDLRPCDPLPGLPEDPAAAALRLLLADRHQRPEHRSRILEDLVRNREMILRERDPRVIDLIAWSEQVERLDASLRRGRLSLFHFTRAMEATARRCGYPLLPAMGRLDQLARSWAGRDYEATVRVLSAHLVEVEAPGEAPPELHAQG